MILSHRRWFILWSLTLGTTLAAPLTPARAEEEREPLRQRIDAEIVKRLQEAQVQEEKKEQAKDAGPKPAPLIVRRAAEVRRDWDPQRAAEQPDEPTDWRRPNGPAAVRDGSLPGRVRGTAKLESKSQWHDVKLDLRPRGPLVLGADTLALLARPPAGRDDDGPWKVEGRTLAPLARDLGAVPWLSRRADAAAYARWQGQDALECAVAIAAGTVTITPAADGHGKAGVDLAGTIETTDTGRMSNRFGPNTWNDRVTYRLTGRIEFGDAGKPAAFRVQVELEIDGNHHTPGKPINEPYTLKGRFDGGSLILRPLTDAEAKAARRWIFALGADEPRLRDEAMAELRKLSDRVEPLLKEVGLNDDSPEVRARSRVLLNDLLSGEVPEEPPAVQQQQ